jgi:tetratricopeptide (TPR) repeat protein
LQILGRLDEGLPAFEEALRLMEACGDLDIPAAGRDSAEGTRWTEPAEPGRSGRPGAQTSVARARPWLLRYELALILSDMSGALFTKGQFQDSASLVGRSVAVAERLGDPRYSAWTLTVRACVRVVIGDWAGARADAQQSVALYQQFGLASRFAFGLGVRGWVHLWGGAWDAATRDLQEFLAICERSGDLQALRSCQGWLAELDIGMGRPAAARERLIPLLDRPGLHEADVTELVLPTLAWACLELGEVAQASDLALQAVRRARTEESLFALVTSLWIQALVAIRQGRRGEARQALDEGLSLARTTSYPYAEARLLRTYGELHATTAGPQRAREHLEAALAIFRQLGAHKDVDRVEHLLTALG